MRIYIAGPITGMEHIDLNVRAFAEAANALRELGHDPVNPHDLHNGVTDDPRWMYMRRCIPVLVECDAILMLDDWIRSRGARLEREIMIQTGKRVFYRVGDVPCKAKS